MSIILSLCQYVWLCVKDDRNNGNDPASSNEENGMQADQGSEWENKNCREMAHQKVDTKVMFDLISGFFE